MDDNNIQSSNDFNIISSIHGERFLFEINRDDFRTNESTHVFQNTYGDVFSQADTLFIIIGTDSGLLPKFVESELSHGSRAIFIEVPDVIDSFQKNNIAIPNTSQIAVVAPDKWVEKSLEYGLQNYLFTERCKKYKSLAAINGHISEYTELWHSIVDEIDQLIWDTQTTLGQKTFSERDIENLVDNVFPASILTGKFKSKPAVILGGGPSLDQVLPWIEKNQEKLYILAASRISKQLKGYGITPDFIFGIDPNPALLNVSRDMFEFSSTSIFIHATYTNSTILSQWSGRHLYVGHRLRWNTSDDADNFSVTPPTVSNTALTAAIIMGFEKIILGGIDLCYSDAGYSHAEGSDEFGAGPKLSEISSYVKTNAGNIAETNAAYKHAITILGAQANMAKSYGSTIYNASKNAAKIPGIEYCSIDDFALSNLSIDKGEHINDAMPMLDQSQRLTHIKFSLREILNMELSLSEIIRLSDEALKANAKIYRDGYQTIDKKQKDIIDTVETRLNEQFKSTTYFIKTYGIRRFAKTIRPKDKSWSAMEAKEWTDTYYSAYRESTIELKRVLERARNKIETRYEEEQENPNFRRLFALWMKTNSPMRIKILESRNPEAYRDASAQFPHLIERLEQSIHWMKTNKHYYFKKKREFVEPTEMLEKARWLFQKKDTEGLRKLSSLLSYKNDSSLKNIHLLSKGFYHQLEGNAQQALEHYQSLEPGIGLEDALAQMGTLLIDAGDADNATVALECLSHISPVYMPQYAEILRITGRIKESLEEYAKYIELMPGDINALHKLGQLYLDLESFDGARLVYEHILNISPSDKVAHQRLASIPDY